jgi:hypothetical protein
VLCGQRGPLLNPVWMRMTVCLKLGCSRPYVIPHYGESGVEGIGRQDVMSSRDRSFSPLALRLRQRRQQRGPHRCDIGCKDSGAGNDVQHRCLIKLDAPSARVPGKAAARVRCV